MSKLPTNCEKVTRFLKIYLYAKQDKQKYLIKTIITTQLNVYILQKS